MLQRQAAALADEHGGPADPEGNAHPEHYYFGYYKSRAAPARAATAPSSRQRALRNRPDGVHCAELGFRIRHSRDGHHRGFIVRNETAAYASEPWWTDYFHSSPKSIGAKLGASQAAAEQVAARAAPDPRARASSTSGGGHWRPGGIAQPRSRRPPATDFDGGSREASRERRFGRAGRRGDARAGERKKNNSVGATVRRDARPGGPAGRVRSHSRPRVGADSTGGARRAQPRADNLTKQGAASMRDWLEKKRSRERRRYSRPSAYKVLTAHTAPGKQADPAAAPVLEQFPAPPTAKLVPAKKTIKQRLIGANVLFPTSKAAPARGGVRKEMRRRGGGGRASPRRDGLPPQRPRRTKASIAKATVASMRSGARRSAAANVDPVPTLSGLRDLAKLDQKLGSGRSGRAGSGRVASGRIASGRVGSGRIGSGRTGAGRPKARLEERAKELCSALSRFDGPRAGPGLYNFVFDGGNRQKK